MITAMVQLVVKFKEDSKMKKITHEAALDSIIEVRFNEVLHNDSIILSQIEKQKLETEALKTQLSNLKYKLSTLTEQ